MPRQLELLPIPTGDRLLTLIPALQATLTGSGPVFLPVPDHGGPETAVLASTLAADTEMAEWEDDPDDPTAVVVATSGSTGVPKGALLTASNLVASAEATRRRLSVRHSRRQDVQEPRNWLLILPATHIAGLQVVLRALHEGTEPTVLDTALPFTAQRFVQAVDRMPSGPRFTSLVPTQLSRILADPEAAAALATFDAVLVGGAATSPPLVDEAARIGVQIVTTYGMSETCGGCVYDGLPLDGVGLSLDLTVPLGSFGSVDSADPLDVVPSSVGSTGTTGSVSSVGALDATVTPGSVGTLGAPDASVTPGSVGSLVSGTNGRLAITGPVVARGYRGLPGHRSFRQAAGEQYRTFVTDDFGVLTGGRWRIAGRIDDVINTGGIKLNPEVLEATLLSVPGVSQLIVTGVPDPEWGEAIVAVVVAAADASPNLDALRRAARAAHGPTSAPKEMVLVHELPLRGPGKPDRRAVRALAIAELARSRR